MKKTYILGALSLAALSIAPQSFGQTPPPAPVYGSVSKVTFKYILSNNTSPLLGEFTGAVGTLRDKDETGANESSAKVRENVYSPEAGTMVREAGEKFVTRRFGNKEFLEQLAMETGEGKPIITAAEVKGTSIVKVQKTTGQVSDNSIEVEDDVYFLVKADKTVVSLEDYISTDSELINRAEKSTTEKVSVTTGEAPNEVTTDTYTIKYSELYKMAGTISLNLDGQSFELHGILSGGQKLGQTKGAAADRKDVILSTATKLTSLSGVGYEGEFPIGMVEGSATMSAGVATEVSAFFPAPPAPTL